MDESEYQRKLDELAALEVQLDREYPHRTFRPNGAQERFIASIAREGAYVVVFPAGNGVGKTSAAIAALAAMIWGPMGNPAFAAPFFQQFPYPKSARIVTETMDALESGSIDKEIKKWWAPGRYEPIKQGKNYYSQYRAKADAGEWIIDKMTFEQEISQFESGTAGVYLFNEPPSEEIYNACVRGTRGGSVMLFPMTPLYSAAWIKDKLVDRKEYPKIQVISGSIEENCLVHGKNGVLEHKNIENLLSFYDPEELEARAHGKFMHLSGIIFNNFNHDVHVTKDPIIPPRDAPIYTVCDPAAGRPFAIIFAFADAAGRVYIYDEYPNTPFEEMKNPKFTVADYARVVREKEAGRRVEQRIIDRHYANARNFSTGKSLRQEFEDDYNLDWMDSYRGGEEVETGILKVKKYMSYDKTKPIDAVNQPMLYISPTCKNTIRHIERWARDPKTGKPQDKFKDFADTIRYLCESEPKWTPSPFAGQAPARAPYYGFNRA